MAEHILSATGMGKNFGGIRAVHDAHINVPQGSIVGLIGPNGAGKSTLFNLLSNFIAPDRGQVRFNGQLVSGLPSHELARLGFIRTFQVARVLSRLSVLENMLLGSPQQTGENFFNVWLQAGQVRREEQKNRDRAMEILESVGLAAKAQDFAGALSGGQRKLLEMARTLMTNPKLVLLDEPAAGVNPTLINQICDHILTWNSQGISFLIIEHNMDVVMSLCEHIWVLAEGQNLVDGTPTEIQSNKDVLEAYLGD